jgi:hypothetical protein
MVLFWDFFRMDWGKPLQCLEYLVGFRAQICTWNFRIKNSVANHSATTYGILSYQCVSNTQAYVLKFSVAKVRQYRPDPFEEM